MFAAGNEKPPPELQQIAERAQQEPDYAQCFTFLQKTLDVCYLCSLTFAFTHVLSADRTEPRNSSTASRVALCANPRRAYHTVIAVAYQLSNICRDALNHTYSRKAVITSSEPATSV